MCSLDVGQERVEAGPPVDVCNLKYYTWPQHNLRLVESLAETVTPTGSPAWAWPIFPNHVCQCDHSSKTASCLSLSCSVIIFTSAKLGSSASKEHYRLLALTILQLFKQKFFSNDGMPLVDFQSMGIVVFVIFVELHTCSLRRRFADFLPQLHSEILLHSSKIYLFNIFLWKVFFWALGMSP